MCINNFIKYITALAVVLSMMGSFVGCDVLNNDKSESIGTIKLQGAFLLEPDEELDLSPDKLDPLQRYLLIVYDVTNNSTENIELSPFENSISITFNETNTYEQLSKFSGSILSSFLKNCGYTLSTNNVTLWGGSATIRMVAAFAINKNDITEDCTALMDFDLSYSSNFKYGAKISRSYIQTIHWFDDIFVVEEDPDAYQIAHSTKVRVETCQKVLKYGIDRCNVGDFSTMESSLVACQAMWLPLGIGGVSCGEPFVLTSDLPVFNIESVRQFYPEVAAQVEILTECLNTISDQLDPEHMDQERVDVLNTAVHIADESIKTIQEFYNG